MAAIKEFAVLLGELSLDRLIPRPARTSTEDQARCSPIALNPTKDKPPPKRLPAGDTSKKTSREDSAPPSNERKGRWATPFHDQSTLVPTDVLLPKGVMDEFVLRMNRGVTHSLLDCPGSYTVQVARFTGDGRSRTNGQIRTRFEQGKQKHPESKLDEGRRVGP